MLVWIKNIFQVRKIQMNSLLLNNEMSMYNDTQTEMIIRYMRIPRLPCLPAGRRQAGICFNKIHLMNKIL